MQKNTLKFDSDDDLHLGKVLEMHKFVFRFIFNDNKKYYPKVLLNKCFINCLNRYCHINLL